jgi:hypothetical protein
MDGEILICLWVIWAKTKINIEGERVFQAYERITIVRDKKIKAIE